VIHAFFYVAPRAAVFLGWLAFMFHDATVQDRRANERARRLFTGNNCPGDGREQG
jgi:hypothetical protein